MRYPLVALLVLCLASIACGFGGAGGLPGSSDEVDAVATQMAMNTRAAQRKTAAPTLTAEALRTPEPSPLPGSSPSPESNLDPGFVQPLPPQDLDSYRLVELIAWDGTNDEGAEAAGRVETTIEYVGEPPGMHVSMAIDADEMVEAMGMFGVQGDGLELYMHEGSFYLGMFGGWMQMSMDALAMGFGFGDLPLDGGELSLSSTMTVTQAIRDATYAGQERRNGLETRHYTLDENSFDPAALPLDMEIERVSGDLYLAAEGNYVVAMDLTVEGANVAGPLQQGEVHLAEGSLTYRTDLRDINALSAIEVPRVVLASTMPPQDLPVPDGARQVMALNMLGNSMFALATESQPDDVAEFYRGEMVEMGWSEAAIEVSGVKYSLEYAKDERAITVEIDADAMLGQTSIMLSSGDPGLFFPFPMSQ